MAVRPFEIEQGLKVDGDAQLNANTAMMGNARVYGDFQVDGTFVASLKGNGDFIPSIQGLSLGSNAFRWNIWAAEMNILNSSTFSGAVTLATPTTTLASLRMPHGVAPTTPSNGDTWTTSAGTFSRINGATKQYAYTDSNITGTSNNATNFGGQLPAYYTAIAARLGYTPVQQGTGTGQTSNIIKMGWSAESRLKVTVDSTDLGNVVFDTQLNSVAVGAAGQANNALNLNGQPGSYYLNAANISAGTLGAAYLSGTYGINISGTAVNATQFNGQGSAYYLNAGNMNAGTLADARLPSSMAGKTFTSSIAVTGDVNATSLTSPTLTITLQATLPPSTTFAAEGGGEGGQFYLAKPPTGSTLVGNVVVDLNGNQFRVYESAGTNRGFSIDLTGTAAGSTSTLWHSTNFNPATKLDTTGTAANSTLLGGQAAAYFLNSSNQNAGTLPAARLTGTYAISISGVAANASALNGQAAAYYLNADNMTAGQIPYARLNGGTYGIHISGASGYAASAGNSALLGGSDAAYFSDIPSRLGYTPVRQGGGTNQGANTIRIGWDSTGASRLRAQVDTTDLGYIVFDGQLTNASVNYATNAGNSVLFQGQLPAFFQNAGNLNAGQIPYDRLNGGTYNINVQGNAGTATTASNANALSGQAAGFFMDIPARLGYTPVQQGGGANQGTNKVYIGWWSGGRLRAQVDSSDQGNFVFDSHLAGASVNYATSAGTASMLGGGTPAYFLNSDNQNAGTLPAARLTGTYSININGVASNASALNGQAAAFYQNSTNQTAGTLPRARLGGDYDINITGSAAYATNSGNANYAGNAGTVGGVGESTFFRRSIDTWNKSADNVDRIFFATNGPTYISAGGTGPVVLRAANGVDRFTVDNGGTQVNGNLNVTGDITAYYSSDRSLKDNIVPIESALDKIKAIGGYTYDRNDKDGKREVGVIAQEIQAIMPELVDTREDGILAVDYPRLTALLIEAVKELAELLPK